MNEKKSKSKKVDKDKINVLFSSYVVDDEAILESFLMSISRLDTSNFNIYYLFINNTGKKIELLDEFKEVNTNTCIIDIVNNNENVGNEESNQSDTDEHEYSYMKNYYDQVIKYASENNFDYLFMSECIVTYHPLTLRKMLSYKKDILSTISWSMSDNGKEVSNVKLLDKDNVNNNFDKNDKDNKENKDPNIEFYNTLKQRGIYKVGFFEGSFLINTNCINDNINFEKLYSISSENPFDHFCIRSIANGIEIFVDTNYPSVYMDIDYNVYETEEKLEEEEVKEEKVKKETKKKTKRPVKKVSPSKEKEIKKIAKEDIIEEDIVDPEEIKEVNEFEIETEIVKENSKEVVKNTIPKQERVYKKEIVRPKSVSKLRYDSNMYIRDDAERDNVLNRNFMYKKIKENYNYSRDPQLSLQNDNKTLKSKSYNDNIDDIKERALRQLYSDKGYK